MQSPLQKLASWPAEKREKFLASLSAAELRELEFLSESLLDFLPRVSPALQAPEHLKPLVECFNRCESGPVRAVISTPPQFGKTQLALHALVRMIRRDSSRRHAYISYAADRSEAMSRGARDIAENAGAEVGGTLKIWRTDSGGGVVWTGIGGPLTGFGVTGCMVVDDPIKNRVEAESALMRERAFQWFTDVALSRLHPGASCIVVATRWHEDDLSGRLIKRGWQEINLPAINDAGESLWPSARPVEWLNGVRAEVGEYTWASLYQGRPRPRGGALFGDATFYKQLPDGPEYGFRTAIGVDLAYSKKTHADYSVAVVLTRVTNRNDPKALPLFYVREVVRKQVLAPEFKNVHLRGLRSRYPGAPMRWYAAGAEKGVGDFIRAAEGPTPGVPLEVLPAKGDKFVRAQPFAAAWNGDAKAGNPGRVFVLEGAPWVEAFLGELQAFTGVNDVNDDQVDGGGTAYDLLVGPVNPGMRPIAAPLSIMG